MPDNVPGPVDNPPVFLHHVPMYKEKILYRLVCAFLFLVFFQLCIGISFSQEKKTEPEQQKNKARASIAFGLDLSHGNTQALGLNADLNINWMLHQKTELDFSSSISYLEVGGEKRADKMFLQVLLDHMLLKKVTFFLLTKPSRNLLQEIDFRLETGGGFKFDLIDNYATRKEILNTDLSLSAALIYEFTDRINQDRQEIIRLSLRPRLKQELSENLQFKVLFFYQPSFENFRDCRLVLESEIQFNISKSISFLLKFIGEYNSVVPGNVKKQDYRLLNQLSLGF